MQFGAKYGQHRSLNIFQVTSLRVRFFNLKQQTEQCASDLVGSTCLCKLCDQAKGKKGQTGCCLWLRVQCTFL